MLSLKQEAFVTNYLAGMSQVEAYKAANYAGEIHTLEASASRLLRTVKVQDEIARRREAAVKSQGLSLEQLVKELIENGQLAREAKQYGASTQAFIAAGTALGIYSTKHEIKSTKVNIEVVRVLENMSTEDLELAASRVLALPEAEEAEG